MAAPARRDRAPDRLADEPVGARVLRVRLGAPEVAVALQPRRRRRAPRRTPRPRGRAGSARSATTATRSRGRGTASRSGRRRPPPCPSRAATTRACSRSGSRDRPQTRPRGSSAPSQPHIVTIRSEGTVRRRHGCRGPDPVSDTEQGNRAVQARIEPGTCRRRTRPGVGHGQLGRPTACSERSRTSQPPNRALPPHCRRRLQLHRHRLRESANGSSSCRSSRSRPRSSIAAEAHKAGFHIAFQCDGARRAQ